jgi:hypothetical protein
MNSIVGARFVGALFALFQEPNIPVYQAIQVFSIQDKVVVKVIRNVTNSMGINNVTQRLFE